MRDTIRGNWVPLHEASRRLGLPRRAVERRIRDGTLRARLIDGRVCVFLPEPDRRALPWVSRVEPEQAVDDSAQMQAERSITLVDRVAQLVAIQVEPLLAELRALRERNETLARENGQLQERLRALETAQARPAEESVAESPGGRVAVPADIDRISAIARRLRQAARDRPEPPAADTAPEPAAPSQGIGQIPSPAQEPAEPSPAAAEAGAERKGRPRAGGAPAASGDPAPAATTPPPVAAETSAEPAAAPVAPLRGSQPPAPPADQPADPPALVRPLLSPEPPAELEAPAPRWLLEDERAVAQAASGKRWWQFWRR